MRVEALSLRCHPGRGTAAIRDPATDTEPSPGSRLSAAHANARAWFAAHIAGDYDAGEALAPVAHGFTHYRLQLQPLRWREVAARAAVADNGDLRWVAPGELDSLGIPAPVRKLLLAQ